ncbi:MAG TPA: zinc ribbon domain-containing protein [Blastocatellia bacterium]|nr:zinc ribbon domain-containing protein [Blastocatellia bacterium]
MHCPNCGAEVTEALRYCKRCGMNLSAPLQPGPPKKFPTGLVILFLMLIGVISVVGLTIPIASAQDLVHSGFGPGAIIMTFFISVMSALGLDALLVWLLLKLIKIQQQVDVTSQSKSFRQPVMKDFLPPQIAAPPENIGSVTEHTTRNFDEYEKIIRARQSNKDTT